MAVRGPRATPVGLPQAMSPESALASDIFDQFVSAGTFKAALSTYRQMCDVLQLSPSPLPAFYPRLKAKLRSWRAASLWAKLDKRAAHKCYNRGKACAGMRVLIIGGGPCGIRAAIEAQLLGAKVVVLEKRDRYSRNNVLHLWPFVIHDLRALGAKKFFGKFCAGSIDHISIRQLQLILLKVALLLGVEVHENVTFKDLLEPPEDQSQERMGWRAQVLPADHPASQYEFDVLIGADGKRNTLKGFNRKEFRGKLAIAITANFMNRHTLEEARVQEISGVAFIFNQKFFQDMRESTGIDLENIVYYKDDTHYFVMTAKKQSLLDRGVIIDDYSDTASLLSPENVDRAALTEYARDAADFATGYALPSLEFAVNHYGQADVAMFDFTSMYAADNACRLLERRGHWLLQGLVGDCLLEPFWPTGSGCARGFLSSLDAAWMMRSWAMNKDSPLHVLAERESIYRLLAQTTPENLSKDLGEYSLNPSSRYPNLNLQAVLPSQVRSLCRTDTEICLPPLGPRPLTEMQKKRRRRESIIHPDALLSWCQRQVALYSRIKIENMTTSWKDGLALCAILHRYRPDLIDLDELSADNIAANNQRAFDILEREYGIPPVMTGQEMVDCAVPDKLTMVSYVSQIYETFRREIPQGRPAYKVSKLIEENQLPPTAPLNLLSKISQKIQGRKKYSTEQDTSAKDKSESQSQKRAARISTARSRRTRDRTALVDALAGGEPSALKQYEKILSTLDRESFSRRMQALQEQLAKDERSSSRGSRGRRSGHASSATEDESTSVPGGRSRVPRSAVQRLQEQLNSGSSSSTAKRKENKVGRLGKDEWNVKMLEERLKQQQKKAKEPKVEVEKPRVFKDIFDSKLNAMDARLKAGGGLTEKERARFSGIDERLQRLDKQLREGSLDVGTRGANRVAAMAGYIANVLDAQTGIREKRPPPPPPVVLFRNDSADGTQTPPLAASPLPPAAATEKGPEAVSETCCFCHKRVYLMERLSAEGLFFHRSCFRCDYCQGSLRLGNYAYDRTTPFKGKFYCPAHFRMERPSQRWQEMMKRKQAFLSANPEPPSLMPSSAPSDGISALEDTAGVPLSAAAAAHQHRRRSPSPPHGGAGEDMGDPTQMGSAITPPATMVDAGTMTFQAKTYKVPRQLTAEEVATMMDVDSTPERVEFENSLELLSEDDLLTSELEEEELAQKNLGAIDVATSDDEYSDLSSEEGSESESLVEEIEHSLTLDDTRQMAETWQRKHASSLDAVGESPQEQGNGVHGVPPSGRAQTGRPGEEDEEDSCTEGEEDYDEGEDEEETETETGDDDATSQDIDSDEEYSPPEVLSNDEDGIARSHRHENGRDEEVTVPVPVLNMDKKLSNKAGSSTDSGDEYISDEEGMTISSSEMSSESEEDPPPPKHEIPVIVIDVSPGDQDTELEWGPQEVRAALGQLPAEPSGAEPRAEPETQPQAVATTPATTTFSKLESTEVVSASPKSSDGQTSSDQLSLTKPTKSSESLLGTSVSSELSSSSNVDDLSDNVAGVVHAAREAIAVVVEDLGSLTDVSDVSSAAVQCSESVASQPPSNAEQSPTDTRGYDLLLDRAGSSGSSSLPTPADEVGPSSTGSEASAVCFGRLAGRESGASSSWASSSHRSVSSVGVGGDESEDSECCKPFVVSDCGSPWSPTGNVGPVMARLEHPVVSRTASAGSEHSEDALLFISGKSCLAERPDSSETSTADTVEEATVLQRSLSKEAANDELSPTGSILDKALSFAEPVLAEPGCGLKDGSLEMARLNEGSIASAFYSADSLTSVREVDGTVMAGFQEMPEKESVSIAVPSEASENVPEYVESGLPKGLHCLDRSKLMLELDVENVPEREAVAPDVLSPQSDVTDEDTTCSASISDQEVFPADESLPRYEEHVVTPELQDRPKSGLLFAPIASMSDEDDLTASDAGKKMRRHESELLVEKVVLETTEEVCETPQDFLTTPVNAEPAATPAGHRSDEDDFTVSEWAREGGEKEVLSVLEDLNPEFHFDDRNVTRRRKKKRLLSGNQSEQQEGAERGKSEPGEQTCVRFEDGAKVMTSPDGRRLPDDWDKGALEPPTTKCDVCPLVREPPKFHGYGGSFAEKVRGRPSDGDSSSRDSIYLKSLNINLQRMEFPSIRASSPNSRGSCEELDSDSSATIQSTPVQRSAPIAVERQVKSADPRLARARPQQFPESFHTPAQPLSRPCPDPVTAMLMSRRELARKSVHEDIQNLPYFDSQSLAGDFDDFKTPECGTPTEAFETPPTSRPGWLATGCGTDPERERARREARERARLKSDEELGLSPCSYRRKYARTPAFDEITLTDLLDQEDETFNALDDRSSLRSFSTAQHRLAQFEDDDVDDADEATPVASPARSVEELDRPDDVANASAACAIVPMDPYQIRADVWKPKPKPKRRLFAKSDEEDRKHTTPPTTTRRNLLSFLGFSRNSSGEAASATTKERKDSYNREKAAKDMADNDRSRTFSRLRLTKSRSDKAAPKKGGSSVGSGGGASSAEKADVVAVAARLEDRGKRVVGSVSHQRRPLPLEEMKKHISLDNLKSQPIQLPAKSLSVEFGCLAPRAAEEDSLLDFDDRDMDAAAEYGPLSDKKGKAVDQRRLERLTLRVQRQQELKRLRTAQEIQRRLEEIEVSLRALERRGVLIERALRGEEDEDEDLRTDEKDLTQVLFRLMRQKNKLSREEQELLIRVRDLELENHHSKLQQEMRERMAVDDKEKSPRDIEKERQILSEMLEIVEKRDRLVAQMDQLRIREENEEKELAARILTQSAT